MELCFIGAPKYVPKNDVKNLVGFSIDKLKTLCMYDGEMKNVPGAM